MVQPRSVEGRMLNWQLLGAKGTPLFGLGRRVKQQSMLCTVNAYVCLDKVPGFLFTCLIVSINSSSNIDLIWLVFSVTMNYFCYSFFCLIQTYCVCRGCSVAVALDFCLAQVAS